MEDKAHDTNEKRNHTDHETYQGKHASNILIKNEKKNANDIMEDAHFMIKESHENQRYHQRGVDLLILFHKNKR